MVKYIERRYDCYNCLGSGKIKVFFALVTKKCPICNGVGQGSFNYDSTLPPDYVERLFAEAISGHNQMHVGIPAIDLSPQPK